MWRSDEEKVAVRAFLLMKHMCLEFNKEVAELILSSMLHAYYEGSATGPSGVAFFNDTRTNFLTRSITEVCSCNVAVAYKKLFQSIRNLALTLRNCIAKNNASFRAELYHWKTIKKIVILTSVLSLSHTTSIDPDNARSDNRADVKLGSLVYPLVQVCLGIIRFNSSGEYTPLHLHIIQCLIDISRETGTFIPVSPYLFNILETPGMLSSGKPSTAKPVDFISLCKVPNDVMGTKQYNKLLTNKVFIMLLKYFSIYSTSISFPEMIVAPVSYAKNIIKQTLNAEAKKDLNILISKVSPASAARILYHFNTAIALTSVFKIPARREC